MKKSKKVKKEKSIYSQQCELNPEAHKLCLSMGMAGLYSNIPACDVILQIQAKMKTMGGKFDLETASKIRASVEEKYAHIK